MRPFIFALVALCCLVFAGVAEAHGGRGQGNRGNGQNFRAQQFRAQQLRNQQFHRQQLRGDFGFGVLRFGVFGGGYQQPVFVPDGFGGFIRVQ